MAASNVMLPFTLTLMIVGLLIYGVVYGLVKQQKTHLLTAVAGIVFLIPAGLGLGFVHADAAV